MPPDAREREPAPITLDEMILCDEPGDHPHWIAPDALRLRARKLSWRTIFAGGTKPTVLRLDGKPPPADLADVRIDTGRAR